MEEQPKGKSGFKNSVKYLREISVVVIGVAVTFLASAWITGHREKKILDSHLEAVRIELQDNLEYLKERIVYHQTIVEFGWYLSSKPMGEHHPDSIWKRSLFYDDGRIEKSVLEYSSYLAIEKSAFETLKASGEMNLLRNQSLMRELQKSYNIMDEAKQTVDRHTDAKINIVQNTIIANRIHAQENERINTLLLDPRMEEVFIYFANPYMTQQLLRDCAQQIEKVLAIF